MLPPAKKNFPPSRPASARGAKRHPWRRSRSGRTQDTIDAPRQARASGGLGESVKERRRRLETSANASDGQRLRSTLSSQPPPPPKKNAKKRKQGVGKSCLVLRYVRGCFDPGSKVTVGAAYLGHRATLADGRQCKLEVWDTAGQVRGGSVPLALLSSLFSPSPLSCHRSGVRASSACCSVPYSLCIFLSRSPSVSFFYSLRSGTPAWRRSTTAGLPRQRWSSTSGTARASRRRGTGSASCSGTRARGSVRGREGGGGSVLALLLFSFLERSGAKLDVASFSSFIFVSLFSLTFFSLHHFLENIANLPVTVLVGNKVDIPEDSRVVPVAEAAEFAER